MRHRKSGAKLNRNSSHRKAMFRNMVTSLFKYDRIRTTDAKAKELRRLADHLITLAKRGDLHARRQALSIIMEKKVVHKLFEEAPGRFGEKSGGYTRIVKIGRRPGDAAPVSLIELIGPSQEKKEKPKKKKVAPKVTDTPVVEETAAETEEKEEGAGVADEATAESVDAAAAEESAAAESDAEEKDTAESTEAEDAQAEPEKEETKSEAEAGTAEEKDKEEK